MPPKKFDSLDELEKELKMTLATLEVLDTKLKAPTELVQTRRSLCQFRREKDKPADGATDTLQRWTSPFSPNQKNSEVVECLCRGLRANPYLFRKLATFFIDLKLFQLFLNIS